MRAQLHQFLSVVIITVFSFAPVSLVAAPQFPGSYFSLGGNSSLILKGDGFVWGAGTPNNFELGTESIDEINPHQQLSGIENVVMVASGSSQ